MKRLRLAGLAIAALIATGAWGADITSTVDAGALPDSKKTPLGLYLSPADAAAAIEADPGIVFIDVRDPIEIYFIGHAEGIDAIVPVATATLEYDAKRQGYKMVGNPNFVAEVGKVMAREGKGKDDPLIIMCRSGHRSAAAVRILIEAGYTNVWNMVEGFEGDKDKETGARSKNGWRNAGLPWTYKIPPKIAYPLAN